MSWYLGSHSPFGMGLNTLFLITSMFGNSCPTTPVWSNAGSVTCRYRLKLPVFFLYHPPEGWVVPSGGSKRPAWEWKWEFTPQGRMQPEGTVAVSGTFKQATLSHTFSQTTLSGTSWQATFQEVTSMGLMLMLKKGQGEKAQVMGTLLIAEMLASDDFPLCSGGHGLCQVLWFSPSPYVCPTRVPLPQPGRDMQLRWWPPFWGATLLTLEYFSHSSSPHHTATAKHR